MKRIVLIILLCLTVPFVVASSVFVIKVIRGVEREYIVPQDYVGTLKVIVDSSTDLGLSSTDLFKWNYRIVFPPSGILYVRHAEGIHPMASEVWLYPDGTRLRGTGIGPYPGRVEHVKNGARPYVNGTEYIWEVLPEGQSAKR